MSRTYSLVISVPRLALPVSSKGASPVTVTLSETVVGERVKSRVCLLADGQHHAFAFAKSLDLEPLRECCKFPAEFR